MVYYLGVEIIEHNVIYWGKYIYHYPELGNREICTTAIVTQHVLSLGMLVKNNAAMNPEACLKAIFRVCYRWFMK